MLAATPGSGKVGGHELTKRNRLSRKTGSLILFARVVALTAAIFAALASHPSIAADSTTLGTEKARLSEVQDELKQAESRRIKLQATADRLDSEARSLQKELVAAAARIQAKEADVGQLARGLKGLHEVEEQKVTMLERRSAELGHTLAALQRLSRQPGSAFLTRPETAINAVRSASLLGAVVPSLRAEAVELGEEIAALNNLREEISDERRRLARAVEQLGTERSKLNRLVQKKKNEQSSFAKNAQEQADRAERLAAKAKSIRDLIGRLDSARSAQRKTWSKQAEKRLSGLNRALLGQRPFSTARGALPLPAHGQVTRKFGQLDDTGSPLRVSILKRWRVRA